MTEVAAAVPWPLFAGIALSTPQMASVLCPGTPRGTGPMVASPATGAAHTGAVKPLEAQTWATPAPESEVPTCRVTLSRLVYRGGSGATSATVGAVRSTWMETLRVVQL